ncbi:MAG: STAS/SEC14 domain-containing protein [Planctomycetota bacterium]
MSDSLDILAAGKTLHVKATGKLTKEAYETFVPLVNEQIEAHGKIRVLFELHDFHGWTAGALWEDLKFDCKHWHDIERLAIVGESKWEQGMAAFCKPFTSAKVQYFDHEKLDEAKTWIDSE